MDVAVLAGAEDDPAEEVVEHPVDAARLRVVGLLGIAGALAEVGEVVKKLLAEVRVLWGEDSPTPGS